MDSQQTGVKAQLRQAYTLIKAERKAEAYEILTPLIAGHPDLIDAWWLAAFAAPTPRHAAFACQKVLALNPAHWPAKQLLDELRGEIAAVQYNTAVLKPVKHKRRGGIRPWALMLIISLPILIVGGFVIMISLTGNTFGLPIGHLYNTESEIMIPVLEMLDPGIAGGPSGGLEVGSTGINLNRTGTTLGGTLVVGSEVRYTFAGKANTIVFATLDFAAYRDEKPGKAFQLLNPQGRVIATSATERGGMTALSAVLTSNGQYTLRLLGTADTAQGPYLLVAAAANTGN